jgi:hypothetical protein
MLKHWAGMLGGHSYWHRPQKLGRLFSPGQLSGYFSDLTGKADWPGESDQQGVPLSILAKNRCYWPTTVLQKGLAHWDLWLESARSSSEDYKGFHAAADWALDHQDENGGWAHPVPLHPRALSEYSCMSQGQASSLLVRVFAETQDVRYLQAARRAINAMLTPKTAGGTAAYKGEDLILEEYPADAENTVLNGWIFAIFGLYDYQLAAKDNDVSIALDAAMRGLTSHLPQFDCGYWSLYDLEGTIAGPFYQSLHITQLGALSLCFPQHGEVLRATRERFSRQLDSRVCLARAVTSKAIQKLRKPPMGIQQFK